MRLTFFGGSFDPPHLGHAHVAAEAVHRLQLDRVLLAPVAVQPLKRDTVPHAAYADRLAMVRAMLADPLIADPRLQASALDAPRTDGRANYTYDTLEQLRRTQIAADDELFVLAGADLLLTLPRWHRAPQLLQLADWIIAARPGFPSGELLSTIGSILPMARVEEGPAGSSEGLSRFQLWPSAENSTPIRLFFLPDLSEEVSATAIRETFARGGEPSPAQLAPSVIDYIRQHSLYQASHAPYYHGE